MRRLHRATWTSTELFLTFPTPLIRAINIMPLNAEDTAGRFRVWLFLDGKPPVLAWDRKVEGGFPELKILVSISPIVVKITTIVMQLLLTHNTETAYQRSDTAREVTWALRQMKLPHQARR